MSPKNADGNYDLSLLAGDNLFAQDAYEIKPLAEIERAYIEMAINSCRGNIPLAAKYLGISPSTIYRKKAQWGKNQST